MEHRIKNSFLSVRIAELGGELQYIQDWSGTEYLWQGDAAYWKRRSPNLFPYIARLNRGEYYLDNKVYHMDIHGFAPYRHFSPVEKGETHLTLCLSDDEETRSVYPRRFSFFIRYSLSGSVLSITYKVVNNDTRPLYFGLGGHPGFNVPLLSGLKFEDYRLRFSEPCHPRRILFAEDLLVTGETADFGLVSDSILPLSHSLFDEDAVILSHTSRKVTLEAPGKGPSLTLSFPQMGYLGIWHQPRTDAPYVCLEPWASLPARHGQPTVFEQQKDLISLGSQETYTNTWSISIDRPNP